jgi:hypothetical protein
MALEENSCGASAVNSLDKQRYSVEVRSDEHFGYWRIAGQTPIQGSYDAPDFAFEFSSIVASAGPDAGPNGCRLQQLDQVHGSLMLPDDAGVDAGAPDANDGVDAEIDAPIIDAGTKATSGDAGADATAALEGEHLMTISAAPGTDCRRAALPPEGPFERLPCVVRYSLRGVPIKSF